MFSPNPTSFEEKAAAQGFLPLLAPQVQPSQKRSSAPVDWYERIATQLGKISSSVEADFHGDDEAPSEELTVSPLGVVKFGDAEAIAEGERTRQRGKDYVPPEIRRMKQKAMQDVQHLLERAEGQAEEIRQEAYQQGYLLGYERGYDDGDGKARQANAQDRENERTLLKADLTQFLDQVEEERKRAWEKIEPQAIDLVFALCRQVIKQEIDVSRTVSVSIIKNALRRITDAGSLKVRVNPEDYETVRSHRGEILQVLDGSNTIEFVDDRRIGRGGTIIETENGNIDATVETQLSFLGETLEQMKQTTFEQEAA